MPAPARGVDQSSTGMGKDRDVEEGGPCSCECLSCLTVTSLVATNPFVNAPVPGIEVGSTLPLVGIELEPQLRPPVSAAAP